MTQQPYRESDDQKVSTAYGQMTDAQKKALRSIFEELPQVVTLEARLQENGLSLSHPGILDALERSIDADLAQSKAQREQEEKHITTALATTEYENAKGIFYLKRDVVKKNCTLYGFGINRANVVGNLQGLVGIGVNRAQRINDEQSLIFGCGMNLAQTVEKIQFIGFGAGINYAQTGFSQMSFLAITANIASEIATYQGSDFRLGSEDNKLPPLHLSINIARSVGIEQCGLINIATESVGNVQKGVFFNYSGNDCTQYGLLNVRRGAKRKFQGLRRLINPDATWNVDLSLFYHRGKKKKEQQLLEDTAASALIAALPAASETIEPAVEQNSTQRIERVPVRIADSTAATLSLKNDEDVVEVEAVDDLGVTDRKIGYYIVGTK